MLSIHFLDCSWSVKPLDAIAGINANFPVGVLQALTTKQAPAMSNKVEPFLIPLWEV